MADLKKIPRLFTEGDLGGLHNVADNIRYNCKDADITIPATTSDADILNVWDYLYRFYDDCSDAVCSALGAGIIIFNDADSRIVGLNSDGMEVDWSMP